MDFKKYLNEAGGMNLIWEILDQKKLSKQMLKMDAESKKLVWEVVKILSDSLTLRDRQQQAFNRLRNMIAMGHENEAMLRNQVFKIANELKIKLPSSSF